MLDISRDFQGTTLSFTRAVGVTVYTIGGITGVSDTPNPANKIPIGSAEDTRIRTRKGRKKYDSKTITVNLNYDDVAHNMLDTVKDTGEICTFLLTDAQGTLKKDTFSAQVSNWGFTSQVEGILIATLDLVLTSNEVFSS